MKPSPPASVASLANSKTVMGASCIGFYRVGGDTNIQMNLLRMVLQ